MFLHLISHWKHRWSRSSSHRASSGPFKAADREADDVGSIGAPDALGDAAGEVTDPESTSERGRQSSLSDSSDSE